MTTSMTPLHREHRKLLPYIEALRSTADSVGEAPLEVVIDAVDSSRRACRRRRPMRCSPA
ncbi:MAG: hypothetical protein ACKO27_12820 [Ilumatobacteraceae bacterium]